MKALTPPPAKPAARSGARRGGTFHFEARDVTGTHVLQARGVNRATPASAVASTLAARMALPRTVPWMLRDDSTGAVLEADKPIGEQIDAGSTLVLSPRAHLG
jgi:hypothetical protein